MGSGSTSGDAEGWPGRPRRDVVSLDRALPDCQYSLRVAVEGIDDPARQAAEKETFVRAT